MTTENLHIRDLRAEECEPLGRLMVAVYAALDGFPKPDEQPRYYEMLANIGRFTERKHARVLVARTAKDDPFAWLAMEDIYGEVGRSERFAAPFAEALRALWKDGARETLTRYLAG